MRIAIRPAVPRLSSFLLAGALLSLGLAVNGTTPGSSAVAGGPPVISGPVRQYKDCTGEETTTCPTNCAGGTFVYNYCEVFIYPNDCSDNVPTPCGPSDNSQTCPSYDGC